MTQVQTKSGTISALLLAVLNALQAFGAFTLDAEGAAILNSLALSIGPAVIYFIQRRDPEPAK